MPTVTSDVAAWKFRCWCQVSWRIACRLQEGALQSYSTAMVSRTTVYTFCRASSGNASLSSTFMQRVPLVCPSVPYYDNAECVRLPGGLKIKLVSHTKRWGTWWHLYGVCAARTRRYHTALGCASRQRCRKFAAKVMWLLIHIHLRKLTTTLSSTTTQILQSVTDQTHRHRRRQYKFKQDHFNNTASSPIYLFTWTFCTRSLPSSSKHVLRAVQTLRFFLAMGDIPSAFLIAQTGDLPLLLFLVSPCNDADWPKILKRCLVQHSSSPWFCHWTYLDTRFRNRAS